MTDNMLSPNNVSDIAILVPSWDGYSDVWKPFFHYLFKNWPDCPFSVYLGTTFMQYNDIRVTSLPIGKDIDYSSNLLLMLKQIEQEWVIVWVDDLLLSRQVNTKRILNLIAQAQNMDAASLLLRATNSVRSIRSGDHEIAEIPKGTPYRVSLNPALWYKESLIELLEEGENAWQFERNGTIRAESKNYKFFGVNPRYGEPPLHAINALVKGKLTPEAVVFLERDGLLDYLRERDRLSILHSIYVYLRRAAPNFIVGWWHKKHVSF